MTKPNRDSRLREHLANERTFLAWLRTSIALIGFGLAIARFGLFLRQGQPQKTITQQIVQNKPVINSDKIGLSYMPKGIFTSGKKNLSKLGAPVDTNG